MPKVELTDRFVAGAKPTTGAPQTDYFDSKTPGLALRVTSSGHRAWSFVFTSPKDGKRARMSLGTYPAFGLAKARTRESGGNVFAPTTGGGGQGGETPLPATLPLFVTGLGALGLLGWRRKRKNAA